MLTAEATQAPTTDCAYCRNPIRWLYDAQTRSMVAFDAEPRRTGSHVLHPESGKALFIPFHEHSYWASQPCDRFVLHKRTCGTGPIAVQVGAALQRMARGDTRRSHQAVSGDAPETGPRLTPNGYCDQCAQQIVWVETEQDGRRIPIDPEPHRSGLVAIISSSAGYLARIAGFGPRTAAPRYQYHHLACNARPTPASIRRAAGLNARNGIESS